MTNHAHGLRLQEASSSYESPLSASSSMTATPQNRANSTLITKRTIGSVNAPLNYSRDERVFSAQDTPVDKLAAKAVIVASLESKILSSARLEWNISTSNYDSMQLTGKCYKRTNVNSERNRTNLFVYNYRAEKLPKKYPTLKPKTNRFNMGILDIALRDEEPGETFGDERMARGYGKRVEELPNHPDLRDKVAWNPSVEMTTAERQALFAAMEHQAQENSGKWKIRRRSAYKSPEQLTQEANEKKRQEKEELRRQQQQEEALEQLRQQYR